MTKKTTGKCIRTLGKQQFEVEYNNNSIFELPRTKKERLNQLRIFVLKECNRCWSELPTPVATLKREFLKEMVSGLEK